MAEPVYEAGAWIYKMFITFIVAVISIGIVGTTLVNELNTIEVQKQLLLNKILYSPDGFWYSDNEVMQPGVINEALFSQDTMDQGFRYPAGYGGAQLTLFKGSQELPPIYINEQNFRNIKAQTQAGVRNIGAVEKHRFPVLVKNVEEEVNGWLVIELAMPQLA